MMSAFPPKIKIATNTPGVKYEATATSVVHFTLDDLTGVDTVSWSILYTDDSNTPASYSIATTGVHNELMQLTTLGDGTAAIVQVVVNNGIDRATETPNAYLTTATNKFYVPTLAGAEVICSGELMESDPVNGWVTLLNQALRGYAGVPQVSPTPLTIALRGSDGALSCTEVKLSGASQIYTSGALELGDASDTDTINLRSSGEVDVYVAGAAVASFVAGSVQIPQQIVLKRHVATPSGSALTFNVALGNIQQATLTGNIGALTISGLQDGAIYTFVFIQDGTGSRTLTVPSNMKVAGGAFVLSTGINKRDTWTGWSDGTNVYELSRAMNI